MKKILVVAAFIFCAAGLAQAVLIDDFTDINTGSSYYICYGTYCMLEYPAAVGTKTDVRNGANIIGGVCNLTWTVTAKSGTFMPVMAVDPNEVCVKLDGSSNCIESRTGVITYASGISARASYTLEYGKNANLNADFLTGSGTLIEIEEYGDMDDTGKITLKYPLPKIAKQNS